MARKRWHVLADLIHREGLSVGAEIGVKIGRNASEVLKRCPGFVWYCVDPWDTTMQYQTWDPKRFSEFERQFDQVVRKWPNNAIKHKAYSADAAQVYTDGSLGLVFIDATHEYEDCMNDIKAWLPKLRKGGWMTGHDYHHPRFPGVTEAVDEAFPEGVQVEDDTVWLIQV